MGSIVKGTVLMLVGCAALRGATAGSLPTVHVPGDFATIQEALDSIGSNGVVEVGPGTYGPVRIGVDIGFFTSVQGVTLRGARDAVIDGGVEPGISVLSANHVVVEGFTVVSQDAGVMVSHGADVTVRDVTVASAGTTGILVDAVMDVAVTGSRIESAGTAGISVTSAATETYGPLVVTGNTVVASGGDAIYIHNFGDGAHVVVTGNTVESAGGRGIRNECGLTLRLADNEISSTGGAGISVSQVSDTATVRENTVADAGGAGIELSWGRHVVLDANRVDGAAGDGLAVSAALDVAVRGNTVKDAADSGIVVASAGRGVVLGNAVAEPGVHGVELDATDRVTVAGNRVTDAGTCGFRLENGATGNLLKRNKAFDCGLGFSADVSSSEGNRIAKSNRFRMHRRR